MASLQVGDLAPDVTLSLHTGDDVRLAVLWRERVVVLFFYPKDGTAICTAEACSFRDSYEKFVEAGATVVGVSGDSSASHDGFAAKHRLPFPLASDADGALRKAFGVPRTLGFLPGRVTYVIDRTGVIRSVFRAALASEGHVTAAMTAVKEAAGSR
jgi:peroxiredoxin Q/BCP